MKTAFNVAAKKAGIGYEEFSFFFMDNVKDSDKLAKKLKNAKEKYANIKDDEEIYMLFDDTIFGSAKEGYIITSKRIYATKLDKEGILFDDIKKFYRQDLDSSIINIDKKDGSLANCIDLATQNKDNIVPHIVLLENYRKIMAMVNAINADDMNENEIIELILEVFTSSSEDESDSNLIEKLKKITNKSEEIQPVDSKTLYAQKISSGEIDPVETSFADFEASLNPKEDLKTLYAQKISSGEIDPVETSFADFEASLKNENTKSIQKEKTMTLEEVVEEIKQKHQDAEDLDEIVSDLSDNSYIDHWAVQFCQEELDDIEIGKKLFAIAVDQEDADYNDIAANIASVLNDKEWARELFTKALDQEDADIVSIAKNIADVNGLNDKEWARGLCKNIENNFTKLEQWNQLIFLVGSEGLNDKSWLQELTEKATENLRNNFFEFAGSSSEVITLATVIAADLKEPEKAKELFEMLKQYEDATDLLDAARSVMEIYNDDYKDEYINFMVNRAIEFVDSGYYCDIYNFINSELEDEEWAEEYRNEYEDNMQEDHEEYGGCEDLFDDEQSEDIVEIDTEITGYFKIDIMGNGGEFGYGIIENEEKLAYLRKKMNDDNLDIENYGDDIEVNFNDCDDQLIQCYGPEINYSNIEITVYEDEECEEEIEEVASMMMEESGINTFIYDNPWYSSDQKENFSDDALQFGGYYIEKRVHFPAIVHIPEDSKFDINCVYVGTTNMDETISSNEIVTIVLYIPEETKQKIAELYGVEDDIENLDSYLTEIYREIKDGEHEEIEKILINCICEVGEIEGQGNAEEKYVVVKDLQDEILYERNL